MPVDRDLGAALRALIEFIDAAPLTGTIAELEEVLEGAERKAVKRLLGERQVSPELLSAAMFARERVGRVNDVIHATAIALTLPEILAPGEILKRPSLAAGNDPSRPFDVETNRRVAEFKLARWDGNDAMRKRQVFKDLVQLAAEGSERSAELYVLGQRPIRFLHETTSNAGWALDRAPAVRAIFEKRFGSLHTPIPDFVDGAGAHVKIVDLEEQFRICLPPSRRSPRSGRDLRSAPRGGCRRVRRRRRDLVVERSISRSGDQRHLSLKRRSTGPSATTRSASECE